MAAQRSEQGEISVFKFVDKRQPFVHFTLTHLIKGTQLVKLIATAPQVKGNYLAKIVINH